eukprot:2328965-Alexandrium_andersonii.AAC.1
MVTAARLARLPGSRRCKAARAAAALAPKAAWGLLISGKPLSKAMVKWYRMSTSVRSAWTTEPEPVSTCGGPWWTLLPGTS